MNKKKNIVIFAVCYVAYTAIYIARLNLSMASPGMIGEEILTTSQVGMLGGVFSVVYALGRLINGYISDSKPPWVMISAGLIVGGISNILISFFPPFIGIFILWGFNAFAQSMLWSSVLRIISNIYPEKKAKKMTSYMVTAVATGNILGIIFNTYIINNFGTRFAFLIPGGILLVISVAVMLTTTKIEYTNENKDAHISLLDLFKNHEIKTVMAPALLHGIIKDNISLWMAVFFADRYQINLTEITGFVLFIPVMGFVGRIAYPLCYRLCGENEHKVSLFGFLACILASVPLCFPGIPAAAAMVCLSVIYAAVSVINTSVLSIFPVRFAGSGNVASVSGLMDLATYLGAGIGSFAYGIVIAGFGYLPMFLSWAAVSLASVFVLTKLAKKE